MQTKEKEKVAQRERENPPPPPPLRHSFDSEVCPGLKAKTVHQAAVAMRMSLAEADAWIRYMGEVGWVLRGGDPVTYRNFRRSLRMWHVKEQQLGQLRVATRREALASERERNEAKLKAHKRAEAVRLAKDDRNQWELCLERCAYCRRDKANHDMPYCAMRHALPPNLRERPIPPEECADFYDHITARRDEAEEMQP